MSNEKAHSLGAFPYSAGARIVGVENAADALKNALGEDIHQYSSDQQRDMLGRVLTVTEILRFAQDMGYYSGLEAEIQFDGHPVKFSPERDPSS